MLARRHILLLAVLGAATANHRPRRQYSGYSNVGYSSGGGHGGGQKAVHTLKACQDVFELENGQSVCGYSGCRLRCMPGYNFIATEKRRSVMLTCDHSTGQLTFRDQTWRPEMTLCAPACKATCRHGGTCDAPDTCSCPWPYTGATCEDQRMVADDPNAASRDGPQSSSELHAKGQRRVVCEPGTRMADGSTSVTLVYRDGSWFYPDGRMLLGVDQVECKKISESNKPGQESISNKPHVEEKTPPSAPSDLILHCTPSCQNGGECVATNTCSCPRGYWGPICQVKICTYPRFQTDLHASLGGTLRQMKFECHPGYHTRTGRDRMVVLCRQGVWVLPGGRRPTVDDVSCVE